MTDLERAARNLEQRETIWFWLLLGVLVLVVATSFTPRVMAEFDGWLAAFVFVFAVGLRLAGRWACRQWLQKRRRVKP